MTPLKDELASSWICRTARRYSESPTALATMLWGSRPVWNRDTDRYLTFRDLLILADRMGVDEDLARSTSLRPFAARLRRLGPGPAPGMLRLGVFHRTRRLHGQQYCPDCLAEDEQPYFRRDWRLAFLFACERHDRLLRDACPECDAPVVFHRSHDLGFTRCHVCDASLLVSGAKTSGHTLACQKKISQAWQSNERMLGEQKVTFSSWFGGLKLLCHVLQRLTERGFSRAVPLELTRIDARARLLSAAVWLTEDWPDRMVEALRASCLSASAVVGSTQKPRWFTSTVRDTLHYVPRPRRSAGLAGAPEVEHPDLAALIARRLDGIPAAGPRR